MVTSLWHLQHSLFFSFSLYLLPDKGGGLYTAVPQTDPMECISCRNCRNNNRYVAVFAQVVVNSSVAPFVILPSAKEVLTILPKL